MVAEMQWQQIYALINGLSESYDQVWRQRQRKIGTAFLIVFLMKLRFSRAQSGYQIVIDEIWDAWRQSGVVPPQEKPVAASSVCEARKKLDPQAIYEINREVVDSFLTLYDDEFRWKGRRLFVVDGSKISLPPQLKSNGFGGLNPGMHYPKGLLSVLMHAATGMAVDVLLDSKGDERTAAAKHLKVLMPDDVVIYDRGYFGFNLLAQHIRYGIDAIFRVPLTGSAKAIQDFATDPTKPIDKIVSITTPDSVRKSLHIPRAKARKTSLKVRLIRYTINEKDYIIATTIFDERISPNEFAAIYHERWSIEEHFKASKSILAMEIFHSKSISGVLQEIYATELLITLSRIIAAQAAISNKQKDSLEKLRETNAQIFFQALKSMIPRRNTINRSSQRHR